MFARLPLPALAMTAIALTLATPLLAETKATISGGPAPICAQPGVPQTGDAILPLCSATNTTGMGDHEDDDESEEGDDD
jgi:hypothetical protein